MIRTSERQSEKKIEKVIKKKDIKSLITEPLAEINLNMNSLDARNSEDAIFDKILKNIPIDNGTFYIEHDRENNTFSLKEGKDQPENEKLLLEFETAENKLKKNKK